MNTQPKPQPCAKHSQTKRIKTYIPWKERMVAVALYSANAKQLYKHHINELGHDPVGSRADRLEVLRGERREISTD